LAIANREGIDVNCCIFKFASEKVHLGSSDRRTTMMRKWRYTGKEKLKKYLILLKK